LHLLHESRNVNEIIDAIMADKIILGTRFANKLVQKILSLPAEAALACLNLPFIEKNILYPRYKKYLQEHESSLPDLDSNDLKIVEELRRTGICVTSLESLNLPNTKKFFRGAKKISATLQESSLEPVNKGKHTLCGTSAQMMKYPEVFRWGLNERLLNIVENYLALPVAYDGLSYYFSIADGRDAGPRLWHRDREDRRMIKIGVYINDVNDDGGPFQCVRPEINSLLCDPEKYKYEIIHNKDIKKVVSSEQSDWMTTCTGLAGTVIFVDTAMYYHRGKPPTRLNRSAIFFSYFSRKPRHPFLCERSPFSKADIRNLTEGLSAHQKDCVYWKDRLPSAVKLIPKNQVKV
jgi:hypothetical protein